MERRGANGESEAVVSIYNEENGLSNYVVEVSRFTWHLVKVTLDGRVVADFPEVTTGTTRSATQLSM